MSQQIICPFCLSNISQESTDCPFCNASLQNKNPSGCLPLGTQLDGRYTIGSYLNVDGEGVLYKAVDNQTHTFVIIKEYMPVTLCARRDEANCLHPKEGSQVIFKTTRIDFFELYRTLQQLGKQPGLLQVKDVFECNESVYGVMEYLDGMTLAEYLEKRAQPLSQQEAVNLLMPVLEGVALLHRNGLIHYGICPQNIRITSKGEAKLGGYATMALRTAGGELKSHLFEGYSAPEQYFVEQFTGRFTDVYGMAAVLYRVVTGVMPAPANERRLTDTLKPAGLLNDQIPAYFSTILQQALQMEPQNRLQTLPELMELFADPSKAKEVAHTFEKKSIPKGVWIGGAMAAGVLVVILLLSALLGVFKTQPESSSSSEEAPSSSQAATEKVPDFVGKKYADVYRNTEYTSKYLFRVEEEFSSDVPKGTILSQDPKAGTATTKDESLIVLTVSKGPEEIAIPSVVSSTQTDAETTLKAAGFSNVTINYVDNNGEYAAGYVISTQPAAGEKVSPSQKITVNVAKAQVTPTPSPEPTPSPTPEPTPSPTPEPTPSPTPEPTPTSDDTTTGQDSVVLP